MLLSVQAQFSLLNIRYEDSRYNKLKAMAVFAHPDGIAVEHFNPLFVVKNNNPKTTPLLWIQP